MDCPGLQGETDTDPSAAADRGLQGNAGVGAAHTLCTRLNNLFVALGDQSLHEGRERHTARMKAVARLCTLHAEPAQRHSARRHRTLSGEC